MLHLNQLTGLIGGFLLVVSSVGNAQAERLTPFRFAKFGYAVFQDDSLSGKRKTVCVGESDQMPVFETRKSPANYYYTPILARCRTTLRIVSPGSSINQAEEREVEVVLAASSAFEVATGLARKDKKGFLLNASVYDPKLDQEIAFRYTWGGSENLLLENLELQIIPYDSPAFPSETFEIFGRMDDSPLKFLK